MSKSKGPRESGCNKENNEISLLIQKDELKIVNIRMHIPCS